MQAIPQGATSQSIYFEILDSTSTTGARKTGLAFNTSSLTGYYVLAGGSATAITLATLAAANSAYSSGGFKEVDATNMPGIYRLDPPNAALTGAPSVTFTLKGATGMVQASRTVWLTAMSFQDATRGGMTALPNANAEAAGGLYTRGSGAGQLNQPANGMVDTNMVRILGTAVSTPATAGILDVNVKNIDNDAASASGTVTFPNATLASTANITAGTITTVTNLTNAPTSGDLTATMKTSVATAALTTAMTESYATDGSTATAAQILYQIWAFLAEKSISSTTLTARKLDGSTSAMTFTLSDATNPVSITRAT